ncbi:unnamed protein product [Strongylus vulgaris]|uniref:Uncharacterized protein n=1 Tax=Strongylus vulgaris TaxID=40348 RepID=A0A3P7IJQ5_STRVU|nr:unnamed protein product [Strongylus vulgaris]
MEKGTHFIAVVLQIVAVSKMTVVQIIIYPYEYGSRKKARALGRYATHTLSPTIERRRRWPLMPQGAEDTRWPAATRPPRVADFSPSWSGIT